VFEGNSAYLKTLLPGMTTPLLGGLQTAFFNQTISSVSCLLSCTTTADDPNPSFGSAWFRFNHSGVTARVSSCDGDRKYVFSLHFFAEVSTLSSLSCPNFSMAQARYSPP
jgi:hypothetical protein